MIARNTIRVEFIKKDIHIIRDSKKKKLLIQNIVAIKQIMKLKNKINKIQKNQKIAKKNKNITKNNQNLKYKFRMFKYR